MQYTEKLKMVINDLVSGAGPGAKLTSLKVPAELYAHLKEENGARDLREVFGTEIVSDGALDTH